jgi:hypothetical protein
MTRARLASVSTDLLTCEKRRCRPHTYTLACMSLAAAAAAAIDAALSFMSSLKERGRVKRGFYRSFVRFPGGWGHAGLARGPGVAGLGPWSALFPAAAGPGERLVGVKDRAEPGRRSRRR